MGISKEELAFNKNEDHLKQLCSELKTKLKKVHLGGGEKKIASQHKKGKLTARERIDFLIDDKSEFLEVAARSSNTTDHNYVKNNADSEDGQLIRIFPNPANSKSSSSAYYFLGDEKEGFILVNDIYGRTIKRIKLVNGHNQVDLKISNLDKGIYYINMIVNDNVLETKKLVLQ